MIGKQGMGSGNREVGDQGEERIRWMEGWMGERKGTGAGEGEEVGQTRWQGDGQRKMENRDAVKDVSRGREMGRSELTMNMWRSPAMHFVTPLHVTIESTAQCVPERSNHTAGCIDRGSSTRQTERALDDEI